MNWNQQRTKVRLLVEHGRSRKRWSKIKFRNHQPELYLLYWRIITHHLPTHVIPLVDKCTCRCCKNKQKELKPGRIQASFGEPVDSCKCTQKLDGSWLPHDHEFVKNHEFLRQGKYSGWGHGGVFWWRVPKASSTKFGGNSLRSKRAVVGRKQASKSIPWRKCTMKYQHSFL